MSTEVKSNLRIGIIGAGVAGMSAALLLRKLGHQVCIFERSDKLDSLGAGIQISSNGRFVLDKLGLDNEIQKIASKPTALALFDVRRENAIGNIEIYDRLQSRYNRRFLVLHRADLVKILYKKIIKEGINVFFDSTTKPRKRDNRIIISINDDSSQIEKDLIVVADGVNSSWKKILLKENKFKPISQSAYRFTVKSEYLSEKFVNDNINLFLDVGKHFVSYNLHKKKLVNFVFCKREKSKVIKSWREKISKEIFLKEFGGSDLVKSLTKNIEHVHKWPIIESEIPKQLTTNNVVFIGDAAHGMLPYLAQGANKALEDSWCLNKILDNDSLDLESQLNSFSIQRLDRLKKLDKALSSNERIYHLENLFLRQCTNLVLRLVIKYLPWLIFWRLDWIYRFKG